MQRTGSIVEITERCNGIFLTRTSKQWREYLSEHSISCEIMMESQEVSQDRQAIENRYMVPVEFPDKGHTTVMMPTPPLAFSRYACRTYKPTRGIGDNTEEILKEMGYSKEEIKALTEANVVR